MKTVKDLIKALEKCNPNSPVKVAIGAANKTHPIDYLNIWGIFNEQNGTDTRICVSFQESISIRKFK